MSILLATSARSVAISASSLNVLGPIIQLWEANRVETAAGTFFIALIPPFATADDAFMTSLCCCTDPSPLSYRPTICFILWNKLNARESPRRGICTILQWIGVCFYPLKIPQSVPDGWSQILFSIKIAVFWSITSCSVTDSNSVSGDNAASTFR